MDIGNLTLTDNIQEASYLVGVYYGDGCVCGSDFSLESKDIKFNARDYAHIIGFNIEKKQTKLNKITFGVGS